MNIESLRKFLTDQGCTEIYAKLLAANDNSKQQVYLGESFDVLNVFPLEKVEINISKDGEEATYWAALDFSWITEDFELSRAPHAKFILYPAYPEVRFSGFLLGCKKAPSALMTNRETGRILFFGITPRRKVIGYVSEKDSEISIDYLNILHLEKFGVFTIWRFTNSRFILLHELLRIHQSGWIQSKRLDKHGNILPCTARNCGGYTLEAELGILPNGMAEPDFMGWEVKQFGVKNFENLRASRITLMTPEPTLGFYGENGYKEFVRQYGYPDVSGKKDRLNFGGMYRIGSRNKKTNLELRLIGFDPEKSVITDVNGRIALVDVYENETAAWPFVNLIEHWSRKHNQACYVPSKSDKTNAHRYCYGPNVIIGESTDFNLFLMQMYMGNVFYDPAIKVEDESSGNKSKPRNQFRTYSKSVYDLYKNATLTPL